MEKIEIQEVNKIFRQAIEDYHIKDDINQDIPQKYEDRFKQMLYEKCFIDTIQWHLEDIIRDPQISPEYALEIKRRIDKLNQQRTDLVEQIDDYIYEQFKNITPLPDARINTETPGWAIDRLSILNLKVYHWNEEANRTDAPKEHITKAKNKLQILLTQLQDLTYAIDRLLKDLQEGKAIAKTYKQMKMYNDPELNPVLRKYKK